MLILLSRTVVYTFTKLLNEMMYRRFHEHLNKEKKEKKKRAVYSQTCYGQITILVV